MANSILGERETLAAMTVSARRYPQIWRLLLGLFAAFFTAIVLLILFVLCAEVLLGLIVPSSELISITEIATKNTVASPVSTFLLLLSFIALIIGAKAAAKVHHRSLKSLCGIGDALRLNEIGSGLRVVAVFTLLITLASGGLSELKPNLAVSNWILWLIPALTAVFIQTFAEELVFRGYLQQQLTAISTNPLVWWVLPSLIFGLLHLDGATFGENKWLVAGAAALMALIAAHVTARTGNISTALGLHFGNNAIALLLIGTPGPLSGLSLWLSPVDPSDIEATRVGIIATIIPMIAAYALYIFILRRRAHS